MQARFLAALLPALGLTACAQPQPVAVSQTRLFATDLAGKAPLCTVPPVSLADGKDAAVTLATGGGGWCAVSVNRDGRPFSAALVKQKPRFGSVYVHTVGDDTRIDYKPAGPSVVADSFAVKLIPGDQTLKVTVTGAAK